MTILEIDSRDIELSNLDKLLFAGAGITKGELIDYYRDVARVLVPHARDRPLTLQRFPDGVDEHGFIQQRRPSLFDDVRAVARAMAVHLAERHVDTLTVEQRKDQRRGRLYLDVSRNAWGQTGVLPYSVRAKPGAPVATPLDWNELERKDMSSQRYTLANLRRRLGQKADPWSAIDRHAANLANARAALVRLGKEHGGQRSKT